MWGWLKGLASAIGAVAGVFTRVWDWLQLRKPAKKRSEIAKAVTEHDNKKVNELLQDGLHRGPDRPPGV